MIRKFKIEDTTKVMTIWTKGNYRKRLLAYKL